MTFYMVVAILNKKANIRFWAILQGPIAPIAENSSSAWLSPVEL